MDPGFRRGDGVGSSGHPSSQRRSEATPPPHHPATRHHAPPHPTTLHPTRHTPNPYRHSGFTTVIPASAGNHVASPVPICPRVGESNPAHHVRDDSCLVLEPGVVVATVSSLSNPKTGCIPRTRPGRRPSFLPGWHMLWWPQGAEASDFRNRAPLARGPGACPQRPGCPAAGAGR